MSDINIVRRVEAGLLGLLVGDALGTPYEFHQPSAIPPAEQIEMMPPAGFRRSHVGVPPGTWSDDGAQALCLLASLLECNRLDVEDFARRLSAWLTTGYMAVDGRVFDCGIGTRRALERFQSGEPAILSGGDGEHDNGNGSLMRVLPLALWHRGPIRDLIDAAELQSRPTHRHPIAMVCCALYCVVAQLMLLGARGDDDTWARAEMIVGSHYRENPVFSEALGQILRSPHREKPVGGGFVVDQIWTCRRLLRCASYEEGMRAAIQMGHDTDTTACIAGGLLGIRDGLEAIPQRWYDGLRAKELLAPLLAALLRQESRHPLDVADLMLLQTSEVPAHASGQDDVKMPGLFRRFVNKFQRESSNG
jgi:ADP-ribosylglycohydrolase